ncbi:MAG TPA: aminoglycoside phosphotransferase family protein [Acidimicrobiales bacterium]|nr:aminoglycoside phosphotransferase family protein [Acidimicrobiales bacterium]
MAESEYESWRADRHAAMPSTNTALLEGAIGRAGGASVARWQRIVGGEVNEVYLASLTSGDELVVRVSRQGTGCRFESEQWAVDAARAVGVPVPTILLVERTSDDEGDVALCIQRRIPGHGLDQITAVDEKQRLAGLAGETVARLHTVEMAGCGWVGPDGSAPAPSWERVIHLGATDEQLDALCEQAEARQIPSSWVRAAAREVERHDELLVGLQPRLLHGDFSPNHVLTDGTTVTGIIDLEQAFAGDPAFELVRWNYFYEQWPVEWVIAGYRRCGDLGDDVDLRIRLGRLRLHLALVDFYSRMNHTIALDAVRRRFAEDADWFGFAAYDR